MSTLKPVQATLPDVVAEPRQRERAWLLLAAGCSLVAGATHLWVVPEHLEEWLPAAVFFVVLAVLQLGLAALLLRRPTPLLLQLAAVGTLGIVVFYVLTRTVDLPLLPPLGAHGGDHLPVAWGIGNGTPLYPGEGLEEVGAPDLVCLAAELMTVAAITAVLPVRSRRWVLDLAVGLGGALLVLRVLGVLG
jgi:hypothetical protein